MGTFKKTRSPKLKMLAPLRNQRVNLETDTKTLYYSLPKLKYSLSLYLKHKREYASLDSSHRNHTIRIFYQKIFKLVDCSLHPMECIS